LCGGEAEATLDHGGAEVQRILPAEQAGELALVGDLVANFGGWVHGTGS